MSIYCGIAKVDITPKLGTHLAGYAGEERKASGVHDSLCARIITLNRGEEPYVIISLDLVGIDGHYAEKLTHEIKKRFKILPQNVFVHATHTHSGPGGIFHDQSLIARAYPYMNGYTSHNGETVDYQHDKICEGIDSALKSCETCEILYGEDAVRDIATNRNSPDRPFSSKLRVIEFRSPTGDKTVLYHFACHPTVMHSGNTLISADLPGVTSKELEDREDVRLALFLNGPSADISTRFTRRESSFKEVERLGIKLSEGIFQVMDNTKAIEDRPFKSVESNIKLAIRKNRNFGTLEKELEDLNAQYKQMESHSEVLPAKLRHLESRIEGITTLLGVGENLQGVDGVDTQVRALRLGGLALLSIPGEFYFESGQEITDKFDVPVFIAGNTNDHLGYIVPNSYYDEGHYESFMTLLEKGSDKRLKAKGIDILGTILNG